jgi:hypothetical protein
MKKIITIISIILLFSISIKADNPNYKNISDDFGGQIIIKSVWYKNSEYVLIYRRGWDTSPIMVNKTKDDIEIELAKLRILELKSKGYFLNGK